MTSRPRNLDREPGFWLTVAILLPFIAALELTLLAHDAWAAATKNKRRAESW